jgi:hypothetical protein
MGLVFPVFFFSYLSFFLSFIVGWLVGRRLQDEYRTNPFMRVDRPAVAAGTGRTDKVEVLYEIRLRKNQWNKLQK